jgi:hypothetical protein
MQKLWQNKGGKLGNIIIVTENLPLFKAMVLNKIRNWGFKQFFAIIMNTSI